MKLNERQLRRLVRKELNEITATDRDMERLEGAIARKLSDQIVARHIASKYILQGEDAACQALLQVLKDAENEAW